MNDSTLMMSSELTGLIPDLENDVPLEQSDSAEVICKIADQDIALRMPLISITSYFEFEVLSSLKRALEIFQNRDDIILENIQVIYQDITMSFDGPFKVKDVKLKNINHARQTCMLGFNLLDKTDKQVIF